MVFSSDDRKLMADVGRQFPRFVALLSAWRQGELENIVVASRDSTDVLRGRVQTLTEMQRLVSPP